MVGKHGRILVGLAILLYLNHEAIKDEGWIEYITYPLSLVFIGMIVYRYIRIKDSKLKEKGNDNKKGLQFKMKGDDDRLAPNKKGDVDRRDLNYNPWIGMTITVTNIKAYGRFLKSIVWYGIFFFVNGYMHAMLCFLENLELYRSRKSILTELKNRYNEAIEYYIYMLISAIIVAIMEIKYRKNREKIGMLA